MKRYNKYKDSGIAWLGQIPEHWEVRKLCRLLSNTITGLWGSEPGEDDVDVICYRVADFDYSRGYLSHQNLTYRSVSMIQREQKLLVDGDLLLEKSGGGELSPVGRVVRAKGVGNAVCSNFLQVLRVDTSIANSDFLYYLLHATYTLKVNTIFYNQTTGIQNLNIPKYLRLSLPLPPLPEQAAIVSYLDRKVSELDSFVSKQETQISYLKELKQATIAKAVTRGVDPSVALKDSGIPWLGQIPEHWEVRRAKNMFVRVNREVRDGDEIITCFRDGMVTLRSNRRTEGFTESFKEIGYQGIRKGDLVIHQMDAFAGAIGVSDSDGKGTPVYICLQSTESCFNEYYASLLREMARSGYIKALYRGIRERSSDFRYETFAGLPLPLPPMSEQVAIVSYLDEKLGAIDRLISASEAAIARVRELKQTLIADVVTGRICVQPS